MPGRGDDKLVEFENALFHILADQHQRIDLFVRSKAGEIQRRLGELFCILSARRTLHAIALRELLCIESSSQCPLISDFVQPSAAMLVQGQ